MILNPFAPTTTRHPHNPAAPTVKATARMEIPITHKPKVAPNKPTSNIVPASATALIILSNPLTRRQEAASRPVCPAIPRLGVAARSHAAPVRIVMLNATCRCAPAT